ncbi:hypothetical protein OG625_05900 [Streptomyces sp. NBC_01351]|uniref:hypothetical protein n=1 Tax=Streptomyces sp. NBC_01351 TaxID=2903833 RepID=UPI002E36025F|nr:hypothetical protein [Streptomyces sp. NBC_01351]
MSSRGGRTAASQRDQAGHDPDGCTAHGEASNSPAIPGPIERPAHITRKVITLSRFSITCPFKGNAQWRSIRETYPSEWADVVEFDAVIRQGNARANASGNPLLGQAFLHRSRVPLSEAPIDHVTAAEWAALQQETDAPDAEALEAGVVDGCSPWACRGEQPESVRDDFGLAI